jgi:hypothetical protein
MPASLGEDDLVDKWDRGDQFLDPPDLLWESCTSSRLHFRQKYECISPRLNTNKQIHSGTFRISSFNVTRLAVCFPLGKA